MRKQFRIFDLMLAASLLATMLLPTSVWAGGPCNVVNTSVLTFGATRVVVKTLSAPGFCSATTSNNALGCNPAMASTSMLSASASTAAANPSCGFSCACGPIIIDGNDGLPVELLGFSVEASKPAAADSAKRKQPGQITLD